MIYLLTVFFPLLAVYLYHYFSPKARLRRELKKNYRHTIETYYRFITDYKEAGLEAKDQIFSLTNQFKVRFFLSHEKRSMTITKKDLSITLEENPQFNGNYAKLSFLDLLVKKEEEEIFRLYLNYDGSHTRASVFSYHFKDDDKKKYQEIYLLYKPLKATFFEVEQFLAKLEKKLKTEHQKEWQKKAKKDDEEKAVVFSKAKKLLTEEKTLAEKRKAYQKELENF